MDPISITGLILDVSNIISALINYGKTVKGAKSDMRKMGEELFALKGILDHLATRASESSEPPKYEEVESETSESVPSNQDVMLRVLHQTREFIDGLTKDLEPAQTKFKSLKQKLEWPFTQESFNEHLTRLERVKSWLILVLTADHAAVEKDIKRELGDLALSLKEDLKLREQERNQIANRELFQWIAPVSPADSHLRASEGHSVASGNWFIGGHLKKWLRYGKRQIFFLVGKSGTGKTTLFAQCVDELGQMASKDSSLSVAYFYCTMNNAASQSPVNVLGSLVAQFSGYNPSILDDIRSIHRDTPPSQAHKRPINITVLEDAIIKHASGKTHVVILIDAVNESQDTKHIESSLLRLAQLSSNIRVLVTTTSTMVHPSKADMLNITPEMMSSDIQAYIDYRLRYDDTMKGLKPELKSEIRHKLLERADGSFRWTQLSIDNLCAQRTARAMRGALQNLPGTLREMYANTLDRVTEEDRPFVREALFWLCFAQGHIFANEFLTLEVLNEAVAINEECTTLDEDMMLVPSEILLELCQGLMSRDQSGYVRLAHTSIRDFLISDWIKSSRVRYFSFDASTANAMMMRKCLNYLCLDNFQCGHVSRVHVFKRLQQYKCLRYASFMWPDYAAAANQLGDVEKSLVKKFFDTRHLPRQGNFGTWMQALMPSTDESVISTTHPLYYAGSWGMNSVIELILETDPDIDINAPGGRVGATAVFAAGNRQNFDTVGLLLRAGADPTIGDPGTGFTIFDLSEMRKWSGLREPLNEWLSGKDAEFQEKYRSKYKL